MLHLDNKNQIIKSTGPVQHINSHITLKRADCLIGLPHECLISTAESRPISELTLRGQAGITFSSFKVWLEPAGKVGSFNRR